MKKVHNKPQVIKLLETLAPSIPGYIYWKDKNSIYLGMNQATLEAAGIKSFADFIGKTDYDLWPQFADELVSHDQQVMKTGEALHTEEAITMPNGEVKYFTAVKVPLCDNEGNIIGIIGNSIDITPQKRKTLEYLEMLAPSMPSPTYWKSRDSVYLGMNEFTLKVTGIKSFADFIGKTDYDLWPQFADKLVKHDQKVMRTGKPLHKEEAITMPDGSIKYFTAIKVPLRDDEGNIIGIIGNYIDITAEKEAEHHKLENERLRLENEKHEAAAERQAELRGIIDTAFRHMQFSVIEYLNKDVGIKLPHVQPENIKLTVREIQVLYAIYHKKNSKSAASYLAKKLNKPFTNDSVNTMVSQHLYIKFNVNSVDELINKALLLKMIPLAFPEQAKP